MPRTKENTTFTVRELRATLTLYPEDMPVRVTYESVIHGIQLKDFAVESVDGVETLMLDAEQY